MGPRRRILLAACLLLSLGGAPGGRAHADEKLRAFAEGVLDEHDRRLDAGEALDAPEFPGGLEWFNVARPLTFQRDLRGKVVLLDFWCSCCVNCLHVLPDLEALERRFADQAFAVVGVHSPKFPHEEDPETVREAVRRLGIAHPVVSDARYELWRGYGARAWPTFVLVLPDGTILGRLSGEGHRGELEALVEAALERYADRLEPAALPLRLERAAWAPGALAHPGKVLADPALGRLFVSDTGHHRVLELALDGTLVRAFGDGSPGLRDGPAQTARFRQPQGLARLGTTLYVADTANHALRAVDLRAGTVATVAGTGEQAPSLWRGGEATAPGLFGPVPGRVARLSSPWDVEPAFGGLIVAMAGSHQLWRYDPADGSVEWFSGDGTERRRDDPDPAKAAFAQPSGLAFDGTHLYVADSESSAIVRVDAKGGARTLAGASPRPDDLFHFGDEDGRGHGRRFQHPLGVEWLDGTLVVADTYNHKLKRLDPARGEVQAWLGQDRAAPDAPPDRFFEPGGLSRAGTRLYVADTGRHRVAVVDGADGRVTTLALAGVLAPAPRLREARAHDPFVDLGDTRTSDLGPLAAAANARLALEVALYLPPGWKLDPASPSVLRLEREGAAPVDQPVEAVLTRLVIPALEPGEHAVSLRLLYHPCQEGNECRAASAVLRFVLRAVVGGPAVVRVTERFLP